MSEVSKPLIEKFIGKTSSICVTWTLDFDRFDMKEYSQEYLKLFARYAIDLSFTCKVPIIFNGMEYNYSKVEDCAKLYFGDDIKYATHIENGSKDLTLPEIELCLIAVSYTHLTLPTTPYV